MNIYIYIYIYIWGQWVNFHHLILYIYIYIYIFIERERERERERGGEQRKRRLVAHRRLWLGGLRKFLDQIKGTELSFVEGDEVSFSDIIIVDSVLLGNIF